MISQSQKKKKTHEQILKVCITLCLILLSIDVQEAMQVVITIQTVFAFHLCSGLSNDLTSAFIYFLT